jgi:hypothetical protein
MIKKGVFSPVSPDSLSADEKRNVIPSFIFLKQKYKPNGDIDKVKARLVGVGNHQDKTIFQDTSSPTANINHIFIETTLAAAKGDKIATLDIGAAYLNADMTDSVYMMLDKKLADQFVRMYPEHRQYLTPNGKLIVKLEKALYGCVQSALLWYKCLSKALCEIGFSINPYDECIIHRDKWTEIKIPQEAIDRLNSIAVEEKMPPTKNPMIRIGSEMREVDETPIDN